LTMVTRGVLVTLPARLPKMPHLNPKGLSGSIKPDAANPAIAFWLTIEHQRRRVADLER
jgi:hypothetical protein